MKLVKTNIKIALKLFPLFLGLVFFGLSIVELSALISEPILKLKSSTVSTAEVNPTGTGLRQEDGLENPLDGNVCSLSVVSCVGDDATPLIQTSEVKNAAASKGALDTKRPGDSIKAPDQFRLITKKVCGSLGEQCSKDLLAIAYHESHFDCSVVGDSGRSYGCFQIRTKLHGISRATAQDFNQAAQWTLNNLEAHGYPTLRTIAVKKHNGWGVQADRYVAAVKETAKLIN